jgi:hypothetical protein
MIQESYKYDPLEDKLIVKRSADLSDVIEANKKMYDVDNKRYTETFNHVARVPLIAIEQWAKSKGIKYNDVMNDDKLFKKFLNDPDNRFFRTKPGRV